ncbi:hypothetical protein FSP39_004935 [Pinctada imbricata]|uniref:RING-type domain-containing protein n=1 Tax=Pinctada imbricata TaxID=66713 RepID=A0AA89C363_PINIB|nr:hypothetical protein FSP39_004935 [Pinctada imbricata]
MAIPSNGHADNKSESGESNNKCNKPMKSKEYCFESSCTGIYEVCRSETIFFIRSNWIAFENLYHEINTAIETHYSSKDAERKSSTDFTSEVQNSQNPMKNKTLKVTVTSPAVIVVLGILIVHILYSLKTLHSRGFGAFHSVNQKTASVKKSHLKETIRNNVYTFFKEMFRNTRSSFDLKRYKHILDLSNISFNSTYTVYPVNTLTEYYREIESNPETSFLERMQFDMFRTSTFSEFPKNSPVSTLMLAKAGFYYEGKEDEVKCFKCGKKYRNWQPLDDPIQIHRAISPLCPIVSELGTSTSSQRESQNQSNRGNDESILYRRETGNSHTFTSNGEVNVCEDASNSDSPSNTNENERNNYTEDRGVPSSVGVSQRKGVRYLSNESMLPRVSDTHDNRSIDRITFSQIEGTRNEHNELSPLPVTQSMEGTISPTSNAIANPQMHVPQNRFNPESSSASAFRQSNIHNVSASDHRNIPTSSDSSTTENPSPEGSTISSNRPAAPEVNGPISTDQPRSAASTLEPLGISIEKPRYPQYAVLATRISSFRNWPEHLHQKPEELAKAGFLYEGTNDFTRCFFCAGGLRDWEPEDNPWIEHARWYKKCVFVRQCRGGDFLNLVQEGKIKEAMEKLNGRTQKTERQIEDIMTSIAVQSVLEMGYSQENVRLAVRKLSRDNDQRSITADSVLQCILEIEEGRNSNEPLEGSTSQQETISPNPNASIEATSEIRTEDSTKTLIAENRQLKEQQICKICMDEDISIVFLPCGHMVTCVNCAPAVRKCPLCRRFIKGTVKAILS